MDAIELIISKPELHSMFRFIVKENESNFAPYHNLEHLMFIASKCYEGAQYHSMTEKEGVDMIIAGLLHDFSHSMGKLPDSENVKNAIEYGKSVCLNMTDLFEDGEDYDQRIGRVIRATEYPYVIPAKDLDVQQSIIRDADLMQIFEPTWFSHVFCGLKEEIGIDEGEFVIMQEKFLGNLEMNTEWGKEYWDDEKDRVMKNINNLKTIFYVV